MLGAPYAGHAVSREVHQRQVGAALDDDHRRRLAAEADVIVDCAPLFEERYLMNEQAVRQNIPMIECAVNETEGHVRTVMPGWPGSRSRVSRTTSSSC